MTSYTYDVVSRLRTLGAKLGAADVTSFVYDYDAVGNRVRKSTLSFSEDYAYDVLDRLVSVTRTGGSTEISRRLLKVADGHTIVLHAGQEVQTRPE